jgi:hypothetical protein
LDEVGEDRAGLVAETNGEVELVEARVVEEEGVVVEREDRVRRVDDEHLLEQEAILLLRLARVHERAAEPHHLPSVERLDGHGRAAVGGKRVGADGADRALPGRGSGARCRGRRAPVCGSDAGRPVVGKSIGIRVELEAGVQEPDHAGSSEPNTCQKGRGHEDREQEPHALRASPRRPISKDAHAEQSPHCRSPLFAASVRQRTHVRS